jgi:hypothetical protein
MERFFETKQSLQELIEETIQNLIRADLLLPMEAGKATEYND